MNQTLLSSFGTAFERVEHALDALREGRGVMVLDDEDRENEGDMIFAAETMTVVLIDVSILHG
ncbi:3,4-dihydroxy-2-butanone-4-phosphate synthase, partial [Klebsiella pneumoniae]|uniref:3,4-dihydroxy-2-butanone-4-phosphate synthase n=1 Tax=Klebsiella pneumoniae TaxID=573 RepID=UPI003969AAED